MARPSTDSPSTGSTKGQRKSHTVTLADGDLTVWWSPWHLGQQDAVYHDYVATEQFRPERLARVVLIKAENEDGSRMFADIESIELMTMVDPAMVKELALLMLATCGPTTRSAAGDDPKARRPAQAPTG
jgi:hypothetical protein